LAGQELGELVVKGRGATAPTIRAELVVPSTSNHSESK